MLTPIPTSADSVLISVNPKAGRSFPMLRSESLCDHLRKKGLIAEIHTDLQKVSEKANQLHSEGRLRALVGVGGDGTAAELVNRTVPGLPISLLPAGTANLIAKYLKIPSDPRKMADVIEQGYYAVFDAGRANDRLFLVMLSAGIDADIVHKVDQKRHENYQSNSRKGAHISYFSYIKPIFSSMFFYPYPEIKAKIEFQNEIEEKISRWAFVFNLPRYGWGLPLVPKCVGSDGKLDYCFFKGKNVFCSLLSVCFAQLGSLHRFLPGTKMGTGSAFTLSSDHEVPYQIDGDPGGFLPVKIELIRNRFTVVAPEKSVRKYSK
ncbi:MAG: diacylglycerol kinase family protein [Planctomycetia bacterium]|nr:diacylglycerol kinase family protein [Planctomycetia bacterium]